MSEFQFEDVARAAHARRRDEAGGDKGADPGPGGPAAQLQSLQRTAGNAAVGDYLQREGGDGGGGAASAVKGIVGQGGGSPLPAETQGFLESNLGGDFSDTRVHSGSQAAEAASAVGASNFTVGNELVIPDGPDISTDKGKETMLHEGTHKLQQQAGDVAGTSIGGGVKVSDPSDPFEREADQTAKAIVNRQGDAPVQREGGHHPGDGHDHGEAAAQGQFVQREAEGAPPQEELAEQSMPIQQMALQREDDEVPDEG